jgi:type VI secretion system secreted protein Hcp
MTESKFLLTMLLTKQGAVKGSSTKREGDLDYSRGMEGIGLDCGVKTQVASKTGMPAGKQSHTQITIRKELDAASPKLLQALVTNEVFKSATLQFNRIGPDGKPVVAHTIELTNGQIVRIKPATGSGGIVWEDVTLAYDGLLVNSIRTAILPRLS